MAEIVNKDRRYKRILEELYPDKNIISFQQQHRSLYQEIRAYAEENALSIKDYIIGLGFEYIRKNQVQLYSEDEVITKLNYLFPNKIIGNLLEIQSANSTLYSSLKSIANEKKLKTHEYLREKGYVQKNNSVGQSNVIYDTVSLLELKKEYNFNGTKLAKWLKVSKQNLDQKMSRKRDLYPYWQGKELNLYEVNIINSMIDDNLTLFEDLEDNIVINIYKSITSQDCAILSIIDGDIKCIFNIPEDIKSRLLEKGFNKYDNRDFEILKELNLNSDLVNIDENGILEIKIKNSKLERKISSTLQSRKDTEYGLNQSRYLEFLGFRKTHNNKITDDEVQEVLKKYKDEGSNNIHISTDDLEYHRINNLAHRRGFNSLKDFIESFGYEYKRMRVTNYLEKVTQQIKQNYVVYDNKIYISSVDPLYASLSQYAIKNNEKLDELLNSIGFSRLKSNELPDGYKQFDWAKYEGSQVKGISLNDDLLKLLDERVIQENQIYISCYEPLYDRLFLYSHRHGITIDELLKSLGYERVYLSDIPSESREFHWADDESVEAVVFIEKTLNEIKSIQGTLETSKSLKEKVQRSQELAKAMKKLYNYRCQLCCPDESGYSSPLIEIENDRFYVELHHIIHVSLKDKVTDDSRKKLDTYENVVVVCPHHHKYLHYHHGGFDTLVQDQNGIIYFINRNGERQQVFTDYHLKLRKSLKQIVI